MSSSFSPNLKLELIGTGDQAGVWGTTTNTNLGTLIEQAISGYVEYACTGGTDTITIPDGATGVARNMFLELTGTGGGTLVVPSNKKLYFIYNNTGGGSAVTVKVSGQTGVSVPDGKKMLLASNGTDVVQATNYMVSPTFVTPTMTAPVLGTPASGTLTNCTGLPVSTGISGLGADMATFLATPSSANLAAAVTGETGSGALVFGTSPTLTGATIGIGTNPLTTTNFSIVESGGKLVFKYGATTIASMDSSGAIISASNVTAYGTP